MSDPPTSLPDLDDLRIGLSDGGTEMIAELERIRLRHDRPEEGLAAGAEGTVVLVYPGGHGYEVEFLDEEGWTIAVCTVSAAEIVPSAAPRKRQARSLRPRPAPDTTPRQARPDA